MLTIIDFILDLFRSPASAASFVIDPDGALRDAGLPNVTAAQLASVAATAAPAGYALGGGDPIVGLQRAVADHHNLAQSFASPFSPQTTWAPDTNTELGSRNNTNAEFLSPDQSAGANSQAGAFNLGFGDITLGDKTSNTATNGGVVVDGENDGDIVSGDGAALGDGNTLNNGDILAGAGSNVVVGKDNEVEDNSQTAGDDLIADNDSPVLSDVDTSGGNGGGAAGGDSLIGIGGGNAAGGSGGSGGGIIITDDDVNTGTQIDGNYGSDNVEDNSVNTAVSTETSTSTESSVEDNSSNFESNLGSGNETAIGSGNETAIGSGNETAIGSGNETAIGSGNETNTDLFSGNATSTDLFSGNETSSHTDLFSGNEASTDTVLDAF
ncbi:IniB N-terminal domain-containing protein [Mycobacterium sp. Y57]|uniref:IniB N-terminal domain-containing protein n=1 Tax=Mycolicibacterium xanthum TaxID=2796469 RepID=UPI001C865C32|nr:IniB N-terminal domain-containing protein [Mycolicibacterium xanthum]MBX7431898.1 IniB N-terminal domain-containing protein [Mycolicibacterium xanthum]